MFFLGGGEERAKGEGGWRWIEWWGKEDKYVPTLLSGLIQ